MQNIVKSLNSVREIELFCDIEGHQSPSIITGEAERPDLVVRRDGNKLLMLELTVGFEPNSDHALKGD